VQQQRVARYFRERAQLSKRRGVAVHQCANFRMQPVHLGVHVHLKGQPLSPLIVKGELADVLARARVLLEAGTRAEQVAASPVPGVVAEMPEHPDQRAART
jgi:hypothetical protein